MVSVSIFSTWFDVNKPVQYYPSDNVVWNEQFEKVKKYCQGFGLDACCGRISPYKDNMIRVDELPEAEPDFVMDINHLDFPDTNFDYIFCSHGLEHQENWYTTLSEFRRVVKDDGYICLIIPDERYTRGLDSDHKVEWDMSSFLRERMPDDLGIIDYGVAARQWSFYIVFQKGAKSVPLPHEKPSISNIPVTPAGDLFKIIKVAAISDSPRLTTGFGMVVKKIYEGLFKNAYHIAALGCYDHIPVRPGELPYSFYNICLHDATGIEMIPHFLHAEQPDVIFLCGDPGSIYQRVQAIRMSGMGTIPTIAYFPIEGIPISGSHIELFKNIEGPITYCLCGSDAIKKYGGLDVEWVHHGVDHAPFERYSKEKREKLRELVGWKDKFVIGNIARNKRTNEQPRYLEIASILAQRGYDDILFYLHCVPYESNILQGFNLRDQMEMMSIESGIDLRKCIVFPADMDDQLRGVDYHRILKTDLTKEKMPETPEERGVIFCALSMIDRMNCLDLYVDFSSVQGFGLPSLEAMACGCPVVAVDDDFVRRETLTGAAEFVGSKYSDFWHTGARLVHIDPEEAADKIISLYHDRKRLEEMSIQSLERSKSFRWKNLQDRVNEMVARLG